MNSKFRFFGIVLSVMLLLPLSVSADEGMWLLSLLGKNYADMQKQGFKLTPEDIYNVNRGCIKDAVVGLGTEGRPFRHFCTGEIISDKGLVTTNHHCGYGYLQEHSTVEHDYLRDGFWAQSLEEELPNPGLTASILVRMEDVTDRVTKELSDYMSEADRAEAIKTVSEQIVKEAKRGNRYDATVTSMFNGNQFFLFVYEIYKDVRLVGAPPSSMGNFGGDVDNWSWPRHTCDFSMFRIYAAPNGSPAAYSKSNVPVQPRHHLPVSIREVKDGDFAMVLGFPGSTSRFLTSYGLGEVTEVSNKLYHDIRTIKINILKEEMNASQVIRIKYADKYASCSNYWKYTSEQNRALKRNKIMQAKQAIEDQYMEWAQDKRPKYAEALGLLKGAYQQRREYRKAQIYIVEGLLTGSDLPLNAYLMGSKIEKALDKGGDASLLSDVRDMAATYYKDYEEQVEARLMKALFAYVYPRLDSKFTPDFMKVVDQGGGLFSTNHGINNFDKMVDYMFARSIFTNAERLEAFLKNPSLVELREDPIYEAAKQIYDKNQEIKKMIPANVSFDLEAGMRNFTDGVMHMQYPKLFAPDANSTLRCTYGNVRSYSPGDGAQYSYYTTLAGVMQKEDPDDPEFEVPNRLKELYESADYGRYANSKGELSTCFITTNDITGGNSGSPVLNARGELIGLAFDGNGEAMSGDIDFEEELQRCICLDVHYMLWVIDKYAGATRLIKEMTIVR
ncbi:MAG: S46 family peptidase [Bacteroidales bacterium]|nr:S46 family peptidase [Candidatus Colimorpha onthohippi]